MAGRERALGRRIRIHPALLAVALAAALAIAALRIDLIRVRYGLAEALGQEKALLEERREAVARLRELRDPARLARLAGEYHLTRPARIIDLPLLPAVGGAPPADGVADDEIAGTTGDAR
jgi:hypothetical protein